MVAYCDLNGKSAEIVSPGAFDITTRIIISDTKGASPTESRGGYFEASLC